MYIVSMLIMLRGMEITMSKNRLRKSYKPLFIVLLLATITAGGVFMFSNTIPYQQFIQKNKQLEIRVQSQKKSNGLDVGKAD